ncbi:DUF5133 domain-containing protein [Streptomyces sp. SID8352]|uniref:DUF5133 domain-containing protein n=1 Tax=Streptomyces sp. SID8352 TaxID=2690338 RepID=UPI0013716845|nr:DUF5133 domain-containing protein [Streptomyces sp. SID8352]MYU25269.1 DUF5133 domain-containing protein [Streptomyces sp. SID8352]
MLVAHPAVLRKLVGQYEALRARHSPDSGAESQRRLDDVGYTLCVSTGTRDVESALVVARRQLSAVRCADEPSLTA